MATDGARQDGERSLADTVLVSNRGPLAFRMEDGRPVATNSGGGLAGSIYPIVRGTGATWVACALDEADRAAAAAGMMSDDGLRIELVDPDPEMFTMAYNVVSNATLWFCHHHLFDSARRPRADHRWMEAWDAYRELNDLIARRVAEVAPVGGRVLVQDYHLALMGSTLTRLRPDLRTAHFSHTPFADPSELRMLPTAVGTELLSAMAGFGACGFHTERWATAYRQGLALLGPDGDSNRPHLRLTAVDRSGPASRLGGRAGGGPASWPASKSGSADPTGRSSCGWTGWSCRRTCFGASGPSTSYSSSNRTAGSGWCSSPWPTPPVRACPSTSPTRTRWSRRWPASTGGGTVPGWTPIVLEVEDDYQRSLAALSRYDVLLVNPVRDGLNLVAKEGPVINTRNGVLALSREAGAFDELGPAAVEINPFDVSGTAAVLAQALDMDEDERAERADELRKLILSRRPVDWLNDQLDAAR